MKKILSMAMVIVLTLSLAGCNHSSSVDIPNDTTATHEHDTTENGSDDTTESDSNSTESATNNTDATETTDQTDRDEGNETNSGEESTEYTESTENVAGTDEPTNESTSEPTEDVQPTEDDGESPSHAHEYTEKVTNPTCTTGGYTTYTCSCGSSYTEKIAKTNHNYTDNKVVATCTTAGYTSHTCKTCGYSYKDGNVAAKGHSWSDWTTTKEPTATATGTATRKCNNCGTTEKKTLDKLAESHKHSYTASITKKATCTENGIKTFACSCGHSYTEGIEKTGHNYTSSVVAPTCTAKGYTKFTCGSCGDNYTSNEVAETGHSYQFTSDTATCSAVGVKTETCGKCGNTKTTESAAKGCTNLNTETVNGNCTEDGYTEVTCGDCGTVISNTTIPASGAHENEVWNIKDAVMASPYMMEMLRYINFTDMVVDRCKVCGYFNPEAMYYPGTTRDIAEQMLSYVNELRTSVYGTTEYNLVCDDTLIELANIRAKEILSNFSHYGENVTYTNAGENIAKGACTIREEYEQWYNSSGHYQNMIFKDYKYFGYGYYRTSATGCHYGVQLFWSQFDKVGYFQ